ncbi:transposase [Streptomyces camponoticapitis]|uniref:transposase n=1 Tax=Streptomyces camponoticapitis TaxID=1616125 RepID=UPI001E63B92E|nr:transposase [Streptomyces camponoticapitis]
MAGAAYGTNARFRAGLAQREIDYMLAIRADVSAHPFDARPTDPDRNGPVGCWPQPRYRHRAPSVATLATGLGQEAFSSLTWRQGSSGKLRSRFAAKRVRPAGKAVERPLRAAASAEQCWWDGILPDCWLLVEWPAEAEGPTDYWLSSLPADTPIMRWSAPWRSVLSIGRTPWWRRLRWDWEGDVAWAGREPLRRALLRKLRAVGSTSRISAGRGACFPCSGV